MYAGIGLLGMPALPFAQFVLTELIDAHGMEVWSVVLVGTEVLIAIDGVTGADRGIATTIDDHGEGLDFLGVWFDTALIRFPCYLLESKAGVMSREFEGEGGFGSGTRQE